MLIQVKTFCDVYQIGAIYIWTYVYNLMRMLADTGRETPILGTSASSTVPLIPTSDVEVEEQVSQLQPFHLIILESIFFYALTYGFGG